MRNRVLARMTKIVVNMTADITVMRRIIMRPRQRVHRRFWFFGTSSIAKDDLLTGIDQTKSLRRMNLDQHTIGNSIRH